MMDPTQLRMHSNILWNEELVLSTHEPFGMDISWETDAEKLEEQMYGTVKNMTEDDCFMVDDLYVDIPLSTFDLFEPPNSLALAYSEHILNANCDLEKLIKDSMNENMKREEKQFIEEMFKFIIRCFIRGCHDGSKLLQHKKYGDEEIGAKKGYDYLSFSDLYGSSIPRLYNWMTSPLSTSIGLPSVEEVYFSSSRTSMNHKIKFFPLKVEQLQDTSNGCNLNKYEEVDKPFSLDKLKKPANQVSSFVIVTTVFLWMIIDICSHLSIIQLQPENGPLFIWSSLLEPFGFMVFVWAIAITIVIGTPFSRLQSAVLMLWAILMLVRSAKSITEVYLPILGILFAGWYMLMENQAPHEG